VGKYKKDYWSKINKIRTKMNDKTQEKIGQIQLIQQSMENFAMQRQQFQMQETEIEAALSEISNTQKAYKLIGNIMVLSDTKELSKELKEKKEMLAIRISTIDKQEEKLRVKFEELQQEVLKSLEKKNGKE